jgi:hypothetical protein
MLKSSKSSVRPLGWIPWTGLILGFLTLVFGLGREQDVVSVAGMLVMITANFVFLIPRFNGIRNPNHHRWARLLLPLAFTGMYVAVWVAGYFDDAKPTEGFIRTLVVLASHALATGVMGYQAFKLRDASVYTRTQFQRGTRTAKVLSFVLPMFLVIAAISQVTVHDADQVVLSVLRGELYSVIGIAAVLAAFGPAVGERQAIESEAAAEAQYRNSLAALTRENEKLQVRTKWPWPLRLLSVTVEK